MEQEHRTILDIMIDRIDVFIICVFRVIIELIFFLIKGHLINAWKQLPVFVILIIALYREGK
ncbi:hypothetical protein AS358_06755 [Elizabethkingia anophelis]|nr:hypothetical protein AS358_06755 [Elizabethkingia anophelis]